MALRKFTPIERTALESPRGALKRVRRFSRFGTVLGRSRWGAYWGRGGLWMAVEPPTCPATEPAECQQSIWDTKVRQKREIMSK